MPLNRPSLENLTKDIVGTRLFQRLGKISFLGIVDGELAKSPASTMAYSRAEHSKGVLELALQLCKLLNFSPDEAYTLCAAALLHDAAHPAFSHSLEYAFAREERNLDHHEALRHVLLDSSDISRDLSRVLDRYGVLPERVISVIDGTDRLNFFFSNPLNIDTLDGIRRSYWSMGVFVQCDVQNLLLLSALLFLDRIVSDERAIANADTFWRMKAGFYERFLTGPYAQKEHAFQRAVRAHVKQLDESFFHMTDNDFRHRYPQVFTDMETVKPPNTVTTVQRFEIDRRIFPLDRRSIFLRYRRRRNVRSDLEN